MNDGYALERATKDHAKGISITIRAAIEKVNAKDYPPAEIERLVRNFSTAKVREMLAERQTLVALSEGKVVGTGALQGAEIKSVFVSPDWHRKGIGTALVCELERIAAREGHATLEVSSSLSATVFYAALGYSERSRKFFAEEETVTMSKVTDKTPLA